MAWFVPYQKLDDQQKHFVDNFKNENVWIKGFPGSGKSVLLAHIIGKIHDKEPNARIVLVVFTHALIQMFKAGLKEMGIQADIKTYYDFMRSEIEYDYIFCDEVQDLPPRVLEAMRRRGKNVFVSGDENQSIYDRDPQTKQPTVEANEICNLIKGSSYELTFIHRLTRNIISIVKKFSHLDFFSAKRDLSKQSTQVMICEADSLSEEVEYIMKEANKAVKVGESVAILIPTQNLIIKFVNQVLINEGKEVWDRCDDRWGKPNWGEMNRYLKKRGISIQYVGNGYGSLDENKLMTLMTYHSSKGLDFDNVFIPFMNSDNAFFNDDRSLSRRLFMVAMTRSKNRLYFTYNGEESSYLYPFRDDCALINIHDNLNGDMASTNGSNSDDTLNSLFGI